MNRRLMLGVSLFTPALTACGDSETAEQTPIEAWEQVWDDGGDELQSQMCGTFAGDYPLHTGEVGPEALWEALEEENYTISIDYDDWFDWMTDTCADVEPAE